MRGQITNICWIIVNKRIPEKHLLFHLYTKTFDCVDPCLTVWITGSTMENYETDGDTRLPYLPSENLYIGQEATVRTGHGTND